MSTFEGRPSRSTPPEGSQQRLAVPEEYVELTEAGWLHVIAHRLYRRGTHLDASEAGAWVEHTKGLMCSFLRTTKTGQ